MNKLDGHRIIVENKRRNKNKKRLRFTNCTRWVELLHMIENHSEMACRLRASTIFCMLNPPWVANVPQQLSIEECNIDQTTLLNEDLTIALHTLHNLPPSSGSNAVYRTYSRSTPECHGYGVVAGSRRWLYCHRYCDEWPSF
mmetsp:Transcript_31666/g.36005  ORF Transcript_31666/g.36005 Transcript_31666/m.36005 type:complete len:142 (+) Transcript_31666:107-532(+)